MSIGPTAPEPATAADLVRRIAAGEAGAEAELAESCGGALRFLARRYTRDEADAEDLYQGTLMLALEKIRGNELREPERLGSFLRSLAKNLSIQRYRRRSYAAEQPMADPPDAPDQSRPDPLTALLRTERAKVTRSLLTELGVARDREVLLRYYIGGESSQRICSDLDMGTDHFYRVLHRARKRFRQLWEERGRSGSKRADRTR